MQSTINSDLIRGNIDTIILKALFQGDRYGYDIIKEIEQKSSGQYVLKQPTLYSCLKRLEVQGFIFSYWGAKTAGGRRKYFSLTDLGKELFIKNQTQWEHSRTVIDKLISDRDFIYTQSDENAIAGEIDEAQSDELLEDLLDNEQSLDEQSLVETNETIPQEQETTPENDTEQIEIAASDQSDTLDNQIVQAAEPIQFIDNSSVIRDLFAMQQETIDGSYTNNLKNDTYVAARHTISEDDINPETYFKDVEPYQGGTTYYEDELNTPQNEYVPQVETPSQQFDNSTSLEENYFSRFEQDFSSTETTEQETAAEEIIPENIYFNPIQQIINPNAPLQETEKPQETQNNNIFYDYNSVISTNDNDEFNLKRDYKTILYTLLKNQSAEIPYAQNADYPNALDVLQSTVAPTAQPNEQQNEQLIEQVNQVNEVYDNIDAETSCEEISSAEESVKNRELVEKLDNIGSSVRELGNNIYIRTHSNNAAKEQISSDYYYSNKLMLNHYAILFGIMIVMTAFAFMFLRIGLNLFNVSYDMGMYITAVAISALLPLAAGVLSVIDPNKRKRNNYSFKTSFKYRILIFINCLIIIYCLNIYLGMPLTFSIDYIGTLLLPSLLCLTFPISAIVFNALYTSGKYSV